MAGHLTHAPNQFQHEWTSFFLLNALICTFISHFFDFQSFILCLDGRCGVAKGGQVMLCRWGLGQNIFLINQIDHLIFGGTSWLGTTKILKYAPWV